MSMKNSSDTIARRLG